jgi:uncharacterized protein YxjI
MRIGGYVVVEDGRRERRLGYVTEVTLAAPDRAPGPGTRPADAPRRVARLEGRLLEGQDEPFGDAPIRVATADEVARWLAAVKPARAMLDVGSVALAESVPLALDAGAFDRHTFLCGQSGSGKTYALGTILERLLAETSLRIVVLDPNSDFVRLAELRDDVGEEVIPRYRAAASGIDVRRAGDAGPERLHVRFRDFDAAERAAVLRLDPIDDRDGLRRLVAKPEGSSSTIRAVTSVSPDAETVLAELEESNRLLVQQVFKPIANEYRISVPAPGSAEEGRSLLYVKQKKMRIREDIRFRVSPDDPEHLFMIKSKSVFEFRGRHEVLDAHGAVIGMLEKDFGRSLLRSHWHVRDAAGTEVLEGHEASWIVALLRRFADLGPDFFSLLTWLPFNFVLLREGRQVGTYKRVLGKFRDRYVVELEPDLGDVDRRLIVAFAIGLDALQDR